MCGIVGAVSTRNIVPILVQGLKRLEYRGYDSCGVAVHQGGELRRARSTSRVAELETQVRADAVEGVEVVGRGAERDVDNTELGIDAYLTPGVVAAHVCAIKIKIG